MSAVLIKPRRLCAGDTVAVLSPSWGGPATFPQVFDAGVAVLQQRFGLRVREYPTTRMPAGVLRGDPRARAADLTEAFADPSVAAIFASIGGDDSARLLPYLEARVIRANPKIFMGFSDTTALLTYCHSLGMVTFNGPSVMAGFAQLANFPMAESHVRTMLFDAPVSLTYGSYPEWVDSYADWSSLDNASRVGSSRSHDGWHWLNGSGVRTGRLFGGCVEVLEFLKGSRYWPTRSFWDDRILFLETSEDKPTVDQVKYWLFNYGVQGVFTQLSALLIGRARGYTDDEKAALDDMILGVVADEFGARDLTIVTNMDFGHTDPQWILPLGVQASVDCAARSFVLLESPCQ